MAEGVREPTPAFVWLSAFILFLPDGQVPESVKHKTLLLMLTRPCVLGAEIEWVLGLLVIVGSVVVGFREGVSCREFQFFIHFAAESQGGPVVA